MAGYRLSIVQYNLQTLSSIESRLFSMLSYAGLQTRIHPESLLRPLRGLALLAATVLFGCQPDMKSLECSCSSGFFARGEHCQCTLAQADGKPLRRRFFSNYIKQAPDVQIDGTLTVQQGAVKLWFEDKDNHRHEFIATPGAEMKFSGRPGAERSAASDDVTFSLNLQAIEGSPPHAEGIVVVFDYVVGS
ncbi:MAG: hypothetical protein GC149_15060 [Gammaproteobacteria bacterium]|nr:hypothetical protein [Gammaproteobacteria bacterium]